jgi:hypothetical protein
LEGNSIGEDCKVTFTLEFSEFTNLWVNSSDEIVLKSPNSWFENSGNLDTPLEAILVVQEEGTGSVLFRLSFNAIVATYDAQTDPVNALLGQCNGIDIARPEDLSAMEAIFGTEENVK